MHAMTKDTFALHVDPDTGVRYIAKADEYSKNHQENKGENLSGFMPEIPGCDTCPVASFLKYMSKLNPSLSLLCSLSIKYTNHCIRATGATLLSRASFNPAQIMAVTGHKSVSSLAVYQRVSSIEKLAMTSTLASHMTPQISSHKLNCWPGIG